MARTIEKFSQTLGRILKARGMQSRLSEYRIFSQWERTMGQGIARHARPISLRGSKLILVVDSPAWMQQLSLMKPEIRQKLNAGLGRESVREITLRLGEVAAPDREEPLEERSRATLTSEERERIEQSIHAIGDDETREMLRSLIETDLRSKKRPDAGKTRK
jgi:predicted nucleic acid-binding Zn ribbon protein